MKKNIASILLLMLVVLSLGTTAYADLEPAIDPVDSMPPVIDEVPLTPDPETDATPIEGVAHNFDEVEVVYASEFTAMPIWLESADWYTELAGGSDKPLQILYGRVKLKSRNFADPLDEGFIKFIGENGSERFLSNSMTTGWYDEMEGTYQKLKYIETHFWSAKRLDGTTVTKYVDPNAKSVRLRLNFDENQEPISADLMFYREAEGGLRKDIGKYEADMTTIQFAGDPAAR